MRRVLGACVLLVATSLAQAQSCGSAPLQLQVLGSGNGYLADGRAAPAVLIWINGKPRILIDVGPGVVQRLVQVGATINDLDAILLTDLHAQRSADLPTLVQLPATPARTRPLPVYGPMGNRWTPSTVAFVRTLFDPTRGAWRHLGDYLSPMARTSYKLEPHDVRLPPAKLGVPRDNRDEPIVVVVNDNARITALPVTHGQTPTLVWRVQARGKTLIIGADLGVAPDALEHFAQQADVLLLAPTLTEREDVLARLAALARFANSTKARHLVLSARARAAVKDEEEPTALIRRHYAGTLSFADDLDCVTP